MKPVGKLGIPVVRDRLAAIALGLKASTVKPFDAADQIVDLLPHLRRNVPTNGRERRVVSKAFTPEMADRARELHGEGLTGMEIAAVLGVNTGRVSEALHGLR